MYSLRAQAIGSRDDEGFPKRVVRFSQTVHNMAAEVREALSYRSVYLTQCVTLFVLGIACARPTDNLLERVQKLGLPFRPGDVPVYYSSCCESRALEAQDALIGSAHFYERHLGVRVQIALAALTTEDWLRMFSDVFKWRRKPLELAFVSDQPPYVAVLPLGNENAVDRIYLPPQNQATPATWQLLTSVHVSYPDAVSKFMIHLGLHEIGHLQITAYGIDTPNMWFNELLANYFSYAYLKTEAPKLAIVVEALDLVPLGPVQHTSLEELEKLRNVGKPNYVWYQQQFERRAGRIYTGCGGIDFLTKVKGAFPSLPGRPASASVGEVLGRLESLCPGFESWAAELRNARKQ